MIKLIHAADFHLDAPFSALNPQQAALRRAEQRQMLGRLVDLAQREQADVVLLSGDLLDSPHAYYETTQTLSRTLGGMRAKVFISPGNHDFYEARSPYATTVWPENVHIFRRAEVESVALPALGCVVHGAAFTSPVCDRSPLADFAAPRDGQIHLMCLHGDVDGKGRYGTVTPAEIAQSGLTYLALGHIHACSGVQKSGNTCWAYPGCPEGRGFDELGDKGVLCGTVAEGDVHLDFVPLCRRRYRILTVDISAAESPQAALAAALPRDGADDICRILLTGESGVEGPNLSALEAIAAPLFYSVALQDHTRVRHDVWSRAGEDTLTGLFLREMRRKLEQCGDEAERATMEAAVRFGLAALENREDGRL